MYKLLTGTLLTSNLLDRSPRIVYLTTRSVDVNTTN